MGLELALSCMTNYETLSKRNEAESMGGTALIKNLVLMHVCAKSVKTVMNNFTYFRDNLTQIGTKARYVYQQSKGFLAIFTCIWCFRSDLY